jgi:hypothetical protein
LANRITKVKKLREKWEHIRKHETKRFNEIVRRINNQQEANKIERRFGFKRRPA